MSTISASTTSTTAYKVTADTTGTLVLQTGSTPTTAATIDASQNVLINTSTGYGKFTVQNNAGTGKVLLDNYVSIPTTENVLSIYADASRGYIQSYNNGYKDIIICGSGGNLGVGTTTPDIFSTGYERNASFVGSGTTTAINVSGATASRVQLGVGSTRYGYIYQDASNFMQIATTTALPITFNINGTERARINANGFFKASNDGTYIGSTGSYHEFVNNNGINGGSCFIATFTSSSVGASTSELLTATYRNAAPNNTTHRAIVVSDNAANRMIVYSNGNIQNTNNSYGALSDIKLKENITDATPKLDKLCQLRVVNYNLIGETQKQIGVIAQEVEQVFPSIIDEIPDYENVTTTDEDGNEVTERIATGTATKGVKYSVFVPMLIKAMQEQQAIIETLTNRITALEAK